MASAGEPRRYIVRYITAPSISSFLVPIRFSTGLERNSPDKSSSSPAIIHITIEVWTAFFTFALFLAPTNSATTALTPPASPSRMPVVNVIIILVEPTAPSASGPTNLPTTATSHRLNITCSTFDNISGTEYINIFFGRDPVVISISFDFITLS